MHIGNFVEVKNSTLADGAKANHPGLPGRRHRGRSGSTGAGSITANYDGASKHRTVIEGRRPIGSQLRAGRADHRSAPVPPSAAIDDHEERPAPARLAVARGKQIGIGGWAPDQGEEMKKSVGPSGLSGLWHSLTGTATVPAAAPTQRADCGIATGASLPFDSRPTIPPQSGRRTAPGGVEAAWHGSPADLLPPLPPAERLKPQAARADSAAGRTRSGRSSAAPAGAYQC